MNIHNIILPRIDFKSGNSIVPPNHTTTKIVTCKRNIVSRARETFTLRRVRDDILYTTRVCMCAARIHSVQFSADQPYLCVSTFYAHAHTHKTHTHTLNQRQTANSHHRWTGHASCATLFTNHLDPAA